MFKNLYIKFNMAVSVNPPVILHDRYRLSEWLGRGAGGVVYRAHDEALDREVVIKFLDNTAQTNQVERFLREGRAVAKLSHPNIMAIFDVGQQDGWNYLVLEYIPGKDLRKLQNQYNGKIPIAESVAITIFILQALDAAHAQGLVHRDIKPENIIITPEKQVKVADFGLALTTGETRLTQEGAIVGTMHYLAPECISGAAHDARSDLYAVGAMLYEMLTGQAPFDGENVTSVIARILSGTLTSPGILNPEISPALESFILRLLAKEPIQRFASAGEALSALPKQNADIETEPASRLLTSVANNTAALLEGERQRLASAIKTQTIEPLNLLLSQISTFEQTLTPQPQARMALGVLSALVRQILQQSRDLESNLHPLILETLGIEPALEALKEQFERAKGIHINLDLERVSSRLPSNLELALFRLAQDLFEALSSGYATHIFLRLKRRDEVLEMAFTTSSAGSLPEKIVAAVRERVAALNGLVKLISESAQTGLVISIPLRLSAKFTKRELEVLQCLAEGLSNKEIASQLSISPRTVNYHLDNIYVKLDVGTRTEAAVLAIRHGWARRLSDV